MNKATDRVDHVATARGALNNAGGLLQQRDDTAACAMATIASAEATLALVEQQRIANRLMLAALVSDVELRVGHHGARAGLLGPEGVFGNPSTPDGRCPLDTDIRRGLGL
ncbi:hypothetical protein [Microbacterium sp. 2FI]|uniref:hypothetical protein n=1 Tax=Microbacterium sp. 2FI TaxID=2502193 RepID=UPI0010F4945E|nr:hypothetical protein [Microbacterium sp. 2FI]